MSEERKPTPRYSEEEIAKRIAELGAKIRSDAGDRELLLIGILKGAGIFIADLLRAIPGAVRYEYIDVVREVSDTEIAEAMEIDFLTHFDVRQRHVLMLKDVVSTGVIENYLLMQLRQRNPIDLKLVALLDRPDLRTVDVVVDYSMFTVRGGTFVGYGLDFRGQYSNLRYIGEL